MPQLWVYLTAQLDVVELGIGHERARPGYAAAEELLPIGHPALTPIAGTLEVWLDELHCFVLQAGDGFWFESTHGHRWFNPGDTEAMLLWINTPPMF